MSFRVAIRSAPERRGTVGDPSAFSGTTDDIVVTSSGVYTGTIPKTFTFTLENTAGETWQPTSFVITWDDGEGNTGRFNFGSDYYTGADDIYVYEGVILQIDDNSGSTIDAADTFTVAVTPANVKPDEFYEVAGDADPADVQIGELAVSSNDLGVQTWDGRRRRVARALSMEPRVLVDYLDAANLRKVLRMQALRQRVTLAENYDEDTILLWRAGAGLLPMIGPGLTFARTSIATYTDPFSGLLRIVASGDPRYELGIGGRAIQLSLGADTNLLILSHAQSGVPSWLGSGATVTFDSSVPTVLDPDESWTDADYADGTQRVECSAAAQYAYSVVSATVSASSIYTGSVYVKGRGVVVVALYSGPAATDPPTTLVDSESVTLTDDWQRIAVTGTCGGTKANIRITASEAATFWVGPSQIEAGYAATSWIETGAATATRNAESLTSSADIPATGTISFWFRLALGTFTGAGVYRLIEATDGADRFGIRYSFTTGAFEFHTDASGSALSRVQALTAETWYHVAATWARGTAGNVARALYITPDGGSTVSSTDDSAAWNTSWDGTLTFGGGGGTTIHGWRFEELRIDDRAWTSAEVTDQVERFQNAEWLGVHRALAGRMFYLEDVSYAWLGTVNPDKYLVSLTLGECDREDSSTVTDA